MLRIIHERGVGPPSGRRAPSSCVVRLQSRSSFLAIVSCLYSEIQHHGCNRGPSGSHLHFCLYDTWWLLRLQTATVSKQPWRATGASRTSCFVVLIDGQRTYEEAARARAVRNMSDRKLAVKHHTQTPPFRHSHTHAAPYLRRRKNWGIQSDSPCLVCVFHTEQRGGITAQQCRL